MIAPGAQLKLLPSCPDQVGASGVQLAELPDFSRSHVGVGLQGYTLEPLPLDGPGHLEPLAHFGAGSAGALAAQVLKRRPRHFSMDVDRV